MFLSALINRSSAAQEVVKSWITAYPEVSAPEVLMEEVASAGRAGVISAIDKHYAVLRDLSQFRHRKAIAIKVSEVERPAFYGFVAFVDFNVCDRRVC